MLRKAINETIGEYESFRGKTERLFYMMNEIQKTKMNESVKSNLLYSTLKYDVDNDIDEEQDYHDSTETLLTLHHIQTKELMFIKILKKIIKEANNVLIDLPEERIKKESDETYKIIRNRTSAGISADALAAIEANENIQTKSVMR